MIDETIVEDYKALIFKIGNEEYGVHINQVVSIERMQQITSYPNRPLYVLGVTTIRDVVIPVVDLRAALTGKSQADADGMRMIIVQVHDQEIGLVVDAATDVLDIFPETVQHPRVYETKTISYLQGISKLPDRLIILLDIEKLLEDLTNLDELKDMINEL